MALRFSAAIIFVATAFLGACASNDGSLLTAPPTSSQPVAVTTTSSTASPPSTTTTSTAIATLSPAQDVFCEDLLTVIAVPTVTGGRTIRPDTVTFFNLAERMGYLDLPYQSQGWGKAKATDPKSFVSVTHIFAGAMSTDVGDALKGEWRLNLEGVGIDYEQAFTEVCLQAWELRS